MYQNELINVTIRFKYDVAWIVTSEALRGHSNTVVHEARRAMTETRGPFATPISHSMLNSLMRNTSAPFAGKNWDEISIVRRVHMCKNIDENYKFISM